jgi:hypothetical protein
MMRLIETMKSNASKTGAAFLVASLGLACGDAGSVGDGGGTEGGAPVDGANAPDRMERRDTGSPRDGATMGDAGNGTDAEMSNDASEGSSTSPLVVDLKTAGDFVILAKSGISTVPKSAVTGNVGVSPAAASYITGFSLTADPTNVFSTSPQVTGKLYASNYKPPTPSNLTTAVSDMQLAFTDAAGRPAGVTELGAGNVGGMTLEAGVYRWGTGLLIPTDLTLTGSATDVWILQIAKDLTVSNATKVSLTGGALAKNVFWQVSGAVSVGTTAHFEGVILGKTAISLKTGASIHGRLLAQTAVSIEESTVVEPAP